MIKRSFLILFLAMLAGFVQAAFVNQETAATVGLNYWKAHAPKDLSVNQADIVRTITHTDASVAIYYIFDIQNSGFVIVAADDAMFPVLAFSYEGNWREDEQPEQLISWMEEYSMRITAVRNEKRTADARVSQVWQYYALNKELPQGKGNNKSIDPLCTTRWDQGSGYNYYCPLHPAGPGGRCYAGCVATAMSQIMKFWNWPLQGEGSHSYTHPYYGAITADFSATTYAMDSMTNTLNSVSKYSIARLMYHCGVAVEMNYTPTGSGSYTGLAKDAMKDYFQYRSTIKLIEKSDYTWYDWKIMLRENLEDGKPILYSGSGSGGGHAWVCDGYSDTAHFHMNWGWGGYSNGYFLVDDLSSFPDGHQAVINIVPYFAPYCLSHKVYTDQSRAFGDGSLYSYYWNNTSCESLIQPPNAVSVDLVFTQFNTEENKDVVWVYDGATTSAPLLGTYSGNVIPPALTSSGGSMLIVFSSDGANQFQGWEAMYNATVIGAPENEAGTSVMIFPNPATDRINLHMNPYDTKERSLRLTNLTGQLLVQALIPEGRTDFSIDVSEMPKGVYVLSLEGPDHIQHSKIVLR